MLLSMKQSCVSRQIALPCLWIWGQHHKILWHSSCASKLQKACLMKLICIVSEARQDRNQECLPAMCFWRDLTSSFTSEPGLTMPFWEYTFCASRASVLLGASPMIAWAGFPFLCPFLISTWQKKSQLSACLFLSLSCCHTIPQPCPRVTESQRSGTILWSARFCTDTKSRTWLMQSQPEHQCSGLFSSMVLTEKT